MRTVIISLILVSVFTGIAAAQPLPAGKWRLAEYKFGAKSEHLKDGITTLVIKQNGNLGGDTGCNAYGGSYALATDGKLAITDIISTMRACEEPTPEFERNYFDALENVASVEIKGSTLVIADKNGNFLRFVRGDK